MLDNPAKASVYTDFQALTRLKGQAREQSPEALREVARQFEALFTQMMLKSMRQAGAAEGGILDSDQSLFYRDMFDQQLAVTLSQQRGLGLADMIVRQLGGEPAPAPPPRPVSAPPLLPVPRRIHTANPVPTPVSVVTEALPEGPNGFLKQMWPHARQAARRLGVDPQVLIAQAALETGWGAAVPRFPDGRSSHNLFGIKAHGWSGERVYNQTLEFVAGVAERRREGFRAYSSFAESFRDYAEFLQANPRYSQALEQAGDNEGFVRALHRAGYATDPAYADKILTILDSLVPKERLKTAAAGPISKDS